MTRRRRTWGLAFGTVLGAAALYAPDAHADPRVCTGLFLNYGVLVSLTAGIGAEWY